MVLRPYVVATWAGAVAVATVLRCRTAVPEQDGDEVAAAHVAQGRPNLASSVTLPAPTGSATAVAAD